MASPYSLRVTRVIRGVNHEQQGIVRVTPRGFEPLSRP